MELEEFSQKAAPPTLRLMLLNVQFMFVLLPYFQKWLSQLHCQFHFQLSAEKENCFVTFNFDIMTVTHELDIERVKMNVPEYLRLNYIFCQNLKQIY